MSTPIEDELRAMLREHADGVEPGPDPWALTAKAIDADRRHRRRVAGGVAAAVLAVGVGTGVAVTAGPGSPDHATVPAHRMWSGRAATGSTLAWPTRGSLSADDHFLTRVGDRLARHFSGRVHLLYAGDVRGFRVVLAAGRPRQPGADASEVLGVQLEGPAGTSAAELRLLKQRYVIGSEHVLTWSPDSRFGQRAPLLVLTGSSVATGQVSEQPHYHTDGTVTRDWHDITFTNGVWVGDTGPRGASLVAVRAAGRSTDVFVSDERPLTVPSGPAGVLVADFARSHVVPVSDVRGTVLFRGSVPASMTYGIGGRNPSTEHSTRILVTYALLRLPDGTAFRSAQVEAIQRDGSSVTWRPLDGAPVPARGASRWPLVFTGLDGPQQGTLCAVAPGAQRVLLHGPGSRDLRVPLDSRGLGHVRISMLSGWPGRWTAEVVRDGRSERYPVRTPNEEDPLAANAP